MRTQERVAGLDVPQKKPAVCAPCSPLWSFTKCCSKTSEKTVGTTTAELKELAHWLLAQEVIQVYMDSTSQYWCPIWNFLECFDF